jgi:hypothetical protein
MSTQLGNPKLFRMSVMEARRLCKAELRDDPKALEAYKRWADGIEAKIEGLRKIGYEKARQR